MADAKETVVLGKTEGGKVIEWVRKGRVAVIQFSDGGQLPKELLGGWTDAVKAQEAVDNYFARLAKEKADKEAEAEAALQAELDKKSSTRRRTTK